MKGSLHDNEIWQWISRSFPLHDNEIWQWICGSFPLHDNEIINKTNNISVQIYATNLQVWSLVKGSSIRQCLLSLDKALMGSIIWFHRFLVSSDHSLSVQQSFTFSFKHHLLLINRTYFNQTSQECSFGGPLSNLFKDLNSIENFGCSGIRNGAKCPKCPNFKNNLLWPSTKIV